MRRGMAGGDGIGRWSSAGADGVEDEFVGTEASRFDSWGGEQEELEAELRVGFDLRGSARDDGGELGKHGGTVELG